jgi:hypothetical protein
LDMGSSDVREEFRAPTLTNTGAKASGYLGFVQSEPKFDGESHGSAACRGHLCVAARVAVVAQLKCPTTVHVEFLTPVYEESGYAPIGYDWMELSKPIVTCNAAVSYADVMMHFGTWPCRNATAMSWIQFTGDSTSYGVGTRDAIRQVC